MNKDKVSSSIYMDPDDRALYEEIRDVVGHGNMSKFMVRAMRLLADYGPYCIYEILTKDLSDMSEDELAHFKLVDEAIKETYRNHMKKVMNAPKPDEVKEPDTLNQCDTR